MARDYEFCPACGQPVALYTKCSCATTTTPAPKFPSLFVKPDQLYVGDNGAIFCGGCAGMSVRYSGRDLSGQTVERITPESLVGFREAGMEPKCEGCGKRHELAGLPCPGCAGDASDEWSGIEGKDWAHCVDCAAVYAQQELDNETASDDYGRFGPDCYPRDA